MSRIIPIIDNGHGWDTAGKRSPDGSLLEYKWNREIAQRVVAQLEAEGYDPVLLVPEEKDIALSTRVKRVNNSSELDRCTIIGHGGVAINSKLGVLENVAITNSAIKGETNNIGSFRNVVLISNSSNYTLNE